MSNSQFLILIGVLLMIFGGFGVLMMIFGGCFGFIIGAILIWAGLNIN